MILLDVDQIKDAKITLGLIAINSIFFIVFNIFLPVDYLLLFVQINRNILFNFEIWRLITPMFFHADLIHLISNMFALLIFGSVIELNSRITSLQYIFIYLISGLIGNLFSLFLLPLNVISLGASGAIFGLLGVMVLMIITEDKSTLPFALMYVFYYIIASFLPGINIWAHIAGLLGGILFGYLFYYRKNRNYKVNL